MKSLHATVAVFLIFQIGACRTTPKQEGTSSEVQDATSGTTPFKVGKQTSLEPELEALGPDEISICSFNISFVGHWKARDKRSADLAELMKPCDVVAVQEMVAPPTNYGIDASGEIHFWLDLEKMLKREEKKDPTELLEKFTPWWKGKNPPQGVKIVEEWEGDYQSLHFVGTMKKNGWDYVLSKGDSGKTAIHNNSTNSEWHIVFYRPGKIAPVNQTDMPSGWTMLNPQEPLGGHPVFDRVPYAFVFRTTPRQDGKQLDFVLINVHLHSTQKRENETEKAAGAVRAKELLQIQRWIAQQSAQYTERDFITLGDMNVVDAKQLVAIKKDVFEGMKAEGLPGIDTFATLNDSSTPTNISTNDPKPFDQVIFDRKHTKEIVRSPAYGVDMVIVNLAEKYGLDVNFGGVVANFVKSYSDHVPLLFVMKIGQDDD